MDSYNIVINAAMIDNIVKTDLQESLDLASWKQFFYFILLGGLPSFFIYKIKIIALSPKQITISNIKMIASSLLLIIVLLISFGNFYASFFREHKPLRYYANPSYYIFSSIKYLNLRYKSETSLTLKKIGLDAHISHQDKQRKLIIFVVGETARSDHFSLNGYDKKTNPYLEKENIFSFNNVWSCGTSTAYSVPCMFSIYERSDFNLSKAQSTENILDILQRVGVNVLWLDNNSDSKGVAERVAFQNYKTSEKNSVCDIECRDEGMLIDLQSYIDSHPMGDIFIVLHQIGNHGPSYYKRYPNQFEKFTPTCKTNQLEQCSLEQINNAYDNALLYTDYFLYKTITLLKDNQDMFKAALLYVSDHGESLGENNLYLHGLPYLIAPDTQIHVPMIMWFSKNFEEKEINLAELKIATHKKLSHDNLFSTILGLMRIQTKAYNKKMDIINHQLDL